MSPKGYGSSSSDASNSSDHIYCIYLHISEGVGLTAKDTVGDYSEQDRYSVLLKASLNGVQFETEGRSSAYETFTKFNSNLIWECKIDDIKRMKLNNRPIKLECFSRCGQTGKRYGKLIGSMLLHLKHVKIMSTIPHGLSTIKWHPLGTLASEWRHIKPEISLMLVIVNKLIIERGQMDMFLRKQGYSKSVSPLPSATAFMLQSQKNIYIQLLEQDGLIQVGNRPDMDFDTFLVTLTFKAVRNIKALLNHDTHQHRSNNIVFSYDLLGHISNSDITANCHSDDCYAVNEKFSVNFKTSLKSLRAYFQHLFYIPICIYFNGFAIASHRIELATLLPPEDTYFSGVTSLWTASGTFNFHTYTGCPAVDYVASVHKVHDSNGNQLTDNGLEAYGGAVSSPLTRKDSPQPLHQPIFGKESPCCHNSNIQNAGTVHHLPQKLSSVETDKTPSPSANCKTTAIKSFHSSSTNTETTDFIDYEKLSVRIVEELEQWKSQQVETFLKGLSRREQQCMDIFQQEALAMQTRLATKIAACEQLNAQLENMMSDFLICCNRNQHYLKLFDTAKREIEYSYEKRFIEISAQMEQLKLEIQEKSTLCTEKIDDTDEAKSENAHLKMEAIELRGHIDRLQHHLAISQTAIVPVRQLINIINDLAKQNERCIAAELTSHHCHGQWVNVSQEINKLKLQLLKLHDEKLSTFALQSNDRGLSLSEILNDEQDALSTERSELKSIGQILSNAIDISTDDDDDDVNDDC